MARLPRRDDPAFAINGAASHVWTGKNFVVVRLLVKTPRAFEHDAILHAQIAQGFLRAVRQPEFHAHRIGRRDNLRAKNNAVGQAALNVKRAAGATIPFQPFEFNLLLRYV